MNKKPQDCYIRIGKVLHPPVAYDETGEAMRGEPVTFKSINAAKRAARLAMMAGHQIRKSFV